MIRKTLQEPIVTHEWFQFDGTLESARELYRLLILEGDGVVYYPSFSYNAKYDSVKIGMINLKKGDFFEIIQNDGSNSELGPFKDLVPVMRGSRNDDYFDRLTVIKEEEIDLGQ